MPFRHVVLLQWADDVPEDHVDQVRAGLDALPPRSPRSAASCTAPTSACRRATTTTSSSPTSTTCGDWRAFRDHPAHVLFIEEHITGKLKDRAAIQYQTPANRDPFDFSHARMQEFLAEIDELG